MRVPILALPLVCASLIAAETLESRLPPGGFQDVSWEDPHAGKWQTVDVTQKGLAPGDEDLTKKLQALVDGASGPTVLYFPAGTYRFGKITVRRGDLIVKGDGPSKTIFKATQDGTVFLWQGAGGQYDYKYLAADFQPRQISADVAPGGTVVPLADTSKLAVGDMVLVEEDLDKWTYDAARRGRGGVFTISKVEANQVTLDLPLALGLEQVKPEARNAILAKLKPVRNVGLEGVRIELPDTPGEKASALFFKRVCNGYLKNVECWNPSRHHVEIAYSRRVIVSGCLFEEAKSKGGGGYGYGVLFRDLSTLCKAENNILKDLRHAMATEVGANYCVFAYNLVIDRVRDRCMQPGLTGDAGTEKWINDKKLNGIGSAFITSDVCAHGNFPHQILFEGNIFYDGCVDHSHLRNGPHYFFRNRPLGQPKKYGGWQEGAGIVVMDDSDKQFIVGNVLLNDATILLQKHETARTSLNTFIAANVVQGKVDWGALAANTELPKSLYLKDKPAFWPNGLPWPAFGPDVAASATNRIPALVRWEDVYGKKGLRE